jgi:hypothetical protein
VRVRKADTMRNPQLNAVLRDYFRAALRLF